MKHRLYQEMIDNPLTVFPEDIAQYAVMNSEANDNEKFLQVCNLISLSNSAYNTAINNSNLSETDISNFRYNHISKLSKFTSEINENNFYTPEEIKEHLNNEYKTENS